MRRTVVTSGHARLHIDSYRRTSFVTHIQSHHTAALSTSEALLIAGALDPVEGSQLIDRVVQATGEDSFLVLQRLQALLDMGFVEFFDDLARLENSLYSNRIDWDRAGWSTGYDYLIATLDLPFLGGDQDGLAQAAQVMRRYANDAPDEERYKRFDHSALHIALPALAELIEQSCGANSWSSKQRLLALAACAVAPVRTSSPPWGGNPLYRKLHPSGGARHPTEAYLSITEAMQDLPSGHYHLQVEPPQLVLLEPSLATLPLSKLEPTSGRVPFKIAAALTLTSCFARNRYRYRESRTYRTVHMDVGHVLTNVEQLAASLSVAVFVSYTWDCEATELLTGRSYLDEGVMATVFLGVPTCN